MRISTKILRDYGACSGVLLNYRRKFGAAERDLSEEMVLWADRSNSGAIEWGLITLFNNPERHKWIRAGLRAVVEAYPDLVKFVLSPTKTSEPQWCETDINPVNTIQKLEHYIWAYNSSTSEREQAKLVSDNPPRVSEEEFWLTVFRGIQEAERNTVTSSA